MVQSLAGPKLPLFFEGTDFRAYCSDTSEWRSLLKPRRKLVERGCVTVGNDFDVSVGQVDRSDTATLRVLSRKKTPCTRPLTTKRRALFM